MVVQSAFEQYVPVPDTRRNLRAVPNEPIANAVVRHAHAALGEAATCWSVLKRRARRVPVLLCAVGADRKCGRLQPDRISFTGRSRAQYFRRQQGLTFLAAIVRRECGDRLLQDRPAAKPFPDRMLPWSAWLSFLCAIPTISCAEVWDLVGGVPDAGTKEFVAIVAWRRTVRPSPVRIASDIDD